jgi:hypothetical protein
MICSLCSRSEARVNGEVPTVGDVLLWYATKHDDKRRCSTAPRAIKKAEARTTEVLLTFGSSSYSLEVLNFLHSHTVHTREKRTLDG